MKKVLYVSANGFIGGAEKFLLNIAGIHKETNDPVHFLLFNSGPLEDELKKLNIPVTVLKTKFKLTSFLNLYHAIKEIRQFLKMHNFNIIHSTMGYVQFVMGLSTPFMKINRVWFQHGPIGGAVDYLASIFRVDVLLFGSHFLMNKHYSNFFLRKGKYGRKVIPLPIEIKSVKLLEAFALKKSLGLEGQYVIGMVGRMARGKGFEIGIKAFAGINMPDSKLIVIGSPNSSEDKKYYDELLKLIESKNLGDSVLMIPNQTNISTYYKVMDIFLNPVTIDEGFGLSVAEAMATGVPVISSPYGGLSEFVKENETAEIIQARQPDAVENLKILFTKIRGDEVYSKKLTKNAKNLIESRFSFSQTYVAITDVYQYLNSID
jgi:glycosyltransferase involved in cell wall biosynthesis